MERRENEKKLQKKVLYKNECVLLPAIVTMLFHCTVHLRRAVLPHQGCSPDVNYRHICLSSQPLHRWEVFYGLQKIAGKADIACDSCSVYKKLQGHLEFQQEQQVFFCTCSKYT
ncbi:hypothetical protein AB205_0073030 [Aquarana catesbeiana]|uniref:Uncharacterized protein n=1 Tax=Aquarana catesbeiana TaxID=8400 RepID=A0A2G9S0A3_AQUCT|nr:hypothetical protein AB205_0073030 [Aquarana catesbeiana]